MKNKKRHIVRLVLKFNQKSLK